jgi:uncharacterized protein (DUF2235 family)
MTKNIALCFDGTWNKPLKPVTGEPIQSDLPDDDPTENPENTNVVKIKRLMGSNGPDQIVLYFNGVGTQWYDQISGGIAGAGLDDRIKLGYQLARAQAIRGGGAPPGPITAWRAIFGQ